MKELTKEEIIEILKKKDFSSLIGLPESIFFDAKREPYNLSDNKCKQELAKDISSSANSVGGVVVIGLDAPKDVNQSFDIVKSLTRIKHSSINVETYKNIIKDWVYPIPIGLEIDFIEDSNQLGFLFIYIPTQDEKLKPFLITKTDGQGKNGKPSNNLFGYAIRSGDQSLPSNAYQLQEILKKGINFETIISGELQSLKNKLDDIGIKKEPKEIDAEKIRSVFSELQSKVELSNLRTLGIVFIPKKDTQLPILESELKNILRDHKEYRYAGWDIHRFYEPEIGAGKFTAIEKKYLGIQVFKDGSFYSCCSLERNWLSHATPDGENRINTLALFEYVTHLTEFYFKVFNALEPSIDDIKVSVSFKNMLPPESSKTSISKFKADDYQLWYGSKYAPENEDFISFDMDEKDPKVASYKIIKEIYNWFGIGGDDLPYTIEEEGIKKIDLPFGKDKEA